MAGLKADATLLQAIPQMRPYEPSAPLGRGEWALADENGHYLVYAMSGGAIHLDLTKAAGTYEVRWVDPRSGALREAPDVEGGKISEFQSPKSGPAVLWLSRK